MLPVLTDFPDLRIYKIALQPGSSLQSPILLMEEHADSRVANISLSDCYGSLHFQCSHQTDKIGRSMAAVLGIPYIGLALVTLLNGPERVSHVHIYLALFCLRYYSVPVQHSCFFSQAFVDEQKKLL